MKQKLQIHIFDFFFCISGGRHKILVYFVDGMANTACFIIVGRNDIPIYEAEVGSAAKVLLSLSLYFFDTYT